MRRTVLDNKKITFFIVANQRGTPKKLVIPTSWIKIGVFALLVVVISLSVGVVDYFGLLVQSAENKRLKFENKNLETQFQIVEGKLNNLEKNLERIKSFSNKLKLITDVDDDEKRLKLAIGPIPKTGQSLDELNQPLAERVPAAHFSNQDSEFFNKNPSDLEVSDLVIKNSRTYASLAVRIDKAINESELREQNVIDLWELLSERQSLLNSTPSIKPVAGWYTSRFGYRTSPVTGRTQMHAGLDIAAAPGTPIYSPADGVVSYSGYDGGYGQMVTVDHGWGITTRFGHNSKNLVKVGQKVKRWEIIGLVGNTGRTTGPHLHYEVRINDIPVDPSNYILEE